MLPNKARVYSKQSNAMFIILEDKFVSIDCVLNFSVALMQNPRCNIG